MLESFQELAATGQVEFLAETYYHSLSFLYNEDEFTEQVQQHHDAIKRYFDQEPTVFRNTELIYNDSIAATAAEMGYQGILAEGVDDVLGWRSPNYVYETPADTTVLLKNYKLSDDIAFRFSNEDWAEHPLSVEKYAHWLSETDGDVINLFMDYETFGEHHWEDTGILEFLRDLPGELLKNSEAGFVTPSQALSMESKDEISVDEFTSWADEERDLSAWCGNNLQDTAMQQLYELEEAAKREGLTEEWRKLTTSDHFYYMCIKWFNDGDVHKYFNPYDTPYEAYIAFMNVLNDISYRCTDDAMPVTEQPSLVIE